jgi:hypothetical protein
MKPAMAVDVIMYRLGRSTKHLWRVVRDNYEVLE